jgi:predicted P-loop ATPase
VADEPVVDWVAQLKGRRDRIPGDEKTLVEAIDLCPETAGAIAWDKRRNQLVALEAGPWGKAGAWTSTMTVTLQVYLQIFSIPAKEKPLDRALAVVGSRHEIDPLGDWLNALIWDGVPRLDTWLQRYCDAEGLEIICEIGSKFIISMVARALEPGCQCDHALCLESDDQGVGKDQVARCLGGDYYAADLVSFHGRDAQQVASSHWLIGVGELAAVRRSDLERVKAFLSATTDTFIPKYERHPVTRKRWGCFLFTVNLDGAGYLVDSTGNRRIWPAKIRQVDIAALRRDRDQLFAEAVHRYQKGEKWWPTEKLQWEQLTGEQTARRTEDPWISIIARWLETRLDRDEKPISTAEILTHSDLAVKPGDITQSHAQRVGRILKGRGYERYQERSGPQRDMWFYRLAPKAPKAP